MSDANTDIQSLRQTGSAVWEFQRETELFARGADRAFDEFELTIEECRRRLREKVEEASCGQGQQARADQNELEQMLYEDEVDRRELAAAEGRLLEFEQLFQRYQQDRDTLREQLNRLLIGDTMSSDAHGLREVIRLLQDYLGMR